MFIGRKERTSRIETRAWAANTLFPKKIVPPSCAVLTEKGANENTGEERGLLEKGSQKNQDGEGLRKPAGSPAGTSKEGKSGHSQLIVCFLGKVGS